MKNELPSPVGTSRSHSYSSESLISPDSCFQRSIIDGTCRSADRSQKTKFAVPSSDLASVAHSIQKKKKPQGGGGKKIFPRRPQKPGALRLLAGIICCSSGSAVEQRRFGVIDSECDLPVYEFAFSTQRLV